MPKNPLFPLCLAGRCWCLSPQTWQGPATPTALLLQQLGVQAKETKLTQTAGMAESPAGIFSQLLIEAI